MLESSRSVFSEISSSVIEAIQNHLVAKRPSTGRVWILAVKILTSAPKNESVASAKCNDVLWRRKTNYLDSRTVRKFCDSSQDLFDGFVEVFHDVHSALERP